MQTAISVAVIGALATLIVAVCAHFLQQRREHRLKNLHFKLDRYADFLGGFAEIGSKHKTYEAHLKIADSVNVMNLIASREVLQHVYSPLDYIRRNTGDSYCVAEQDVIIRSIILAIREDRGQSISDLEVFPFRTVSPGIGPGEVVAREKAESSGT